tara:strand:- start:210804 stop:211646 length:843 start_codon:yes stop_codon:yes gene_type:complete
MWRRIESILVQRALRPRKTAAAIVALFLTAIALVQAILFLSETGGPSLAFLAGSTIIWLILLIFLAWFMFDVRTTYNRHEKASFVYNDVVQRWHFNEDGSRNVGCDKTMLFHRDATSEELVDTLFGSVGLSFDDMRYKTSDATIDKTEQPRPDAYNVYWKPPKPIYAGDVYTHSYSYLFPKGEGPYQKSITVASLTPCRNLRVEVSADRKIERIRVKEDGGETQFWDADKIFEPSDVDHAGYIQNLTEHSFQVEIDRVDLGKKIFIIIEFEGFEPDEASA